VAQPKARVRLARPEDADAIVALWKAYVAELEPHDPRYGAQEDAYDRWRDYFLKRLVNSSQAAILVAADGARLVGVIECRIVGGHPVFKVGTHGQFFGHYVLPAHRGEGLGRALVDAAEEWFRGKGLPYYRVVLLDHFQPLAALYESAGMRRCECTYEKFL